MWASRIERLRWSLLSEHVGSFPCALRVEWYVDGQLYGAILDGISEAQSNDDDAMSALARSMAVRTMVCVTRASTPSGHDSQRMAAAEIHP